MSARRLSCVVLLAGSAVTAAEFAPPPKDVVVRSIIWDADATVAPSPQVQSDGLGTYVNSKTLTSIIQAIGDWELDARTPRNATRDIFLDFSQPIPGSGPGGIDPPNLVSGEYPFRAIAKCTLYGNSLLGFAPGATKSCPLHIGFDYLGGLRYALQMDPLHAANGPFPETNFANVTCTLPTSGTGACTQWRFKPSGTFTAGDGTLKYRNVAKLLEYDSQGNFVGAHGDFYVSFAIEISK
jgi:hypothetical protein